MFIFTEYQMDLKHDLFLRTSLLFQQTQLLNLNKVQSVSMDSATTPLAWCFSDKTALFDVLKSSGIVGFTTSP